MPKTKKNETLLLQAFALANECERETIARRIHSVNTLLSLVKINLKKAARHTGDREKIEQIANENYKALEESMRTISTSVRELSPPMFSTVGYVAAMGELCRKTSLSDHHTITWEAEVAAQINLSPQIELQLYRLSQELIQRLLQEAGAQNIHISLQDKKKRYHIRLEHDGNKVDVCAAKQYGIRARAALATAKLRCGKQWVEIQIGHGKKN